VRYVTNSEIHRDSTRYAVMCLRKHFVWKTGLTGSRWLSVRLCGGYRLRLQRRKGLTSYAEETAVVHSSLLKPQKQVGTLVISAPNFMKIIRLVHKSSSGTDIGT
jgi:hypothetical protein